jgi:diketogulonate reductase-like aldo/keto reductase
LPKSVSKNLKLNTFQKTNKYGETIGQLDQIGQVSNFVSGLMEEFLAEKAKYITLNQVNIKIGGSNDKLLIVRDVTSIVMNESIMETKKDMAKMTDSLMR